MFIPGVLEAQPVTAWVLVDFVIIYLAGSLLGVLLEGIWYKIFYKRWETHVVSMFWPLCIIYGFGAGFYYLVAIILQGKFWLWQFLFAGLVGTGVELICGLALLDGLHMRAWDYRHSWHNFRGLVCPSMFLIWGLLGFLICRLYPTLSRWLSRLHTTPVAIIAAVLGLAMLLDLIYALICIARWKRRHEGQAPKNRFEKLIDQYFPDDFMKRRFVEWFFAEP